MQDNGLDAAAMTNGLSSNGHGLSAGPAAQPSAAAEGGDAAPQETFDGVASVAPVGAQSGLDAQTAEDYWSPQCPPAAPFQDDYGALAPLPQHDGTDCLKWDDSLGSHAGHFRVRASWPLNPRKGALPSLVLREGARALPSPAHLPAPGSGGAPACAFLSEQAVAPVGCQHRCLTTSPRARSIAGASSRACLTPLRRTRAGWTPSAKVS